MPLLFNNYSVLRKKGLFWCQNRMASFCTAVKDCAGCKVLENQTLPVAVWSRDGIAGISESVSGVYQSRPLHIQAYLPFIMLFLLLKSKSEKTRHGIGGLTFVLHNVPSSKTDDVWNISLVAKIIKVIKCFLPLLKWLTNSSVG